jgi:dihydrofolate reductase
MSTTTSRPLIAAMQVTLDGYAIGAEGDSVDSWADALELLPPVDAFVLGGGMFPGYEWFWGAVLDDPSAVSAMLGRDPYPREVDYARFAAKTPHLVLSTTLQEATWPSARIVRDVSEVAALKQQPGDAVYAVGGPGLVGSLINAGLVDELRLILHPVSAGAGEGEATVGKLPHCQGLELVAAEPLAAGRVYLTYRLGASTPQSAE